MECKICNLPEMDVNHPKDVTGLLCARCVQVLLDSSQEKIRAAYQAAIDKEMLDKAAILETFLEEEEQNGETRKFNRGVDRERALRKAQSAYHKVRPEHTTGQLD